MPTTKKGKAKTEAEVYLNADGPMSPAMKKYCHDLALEVSNAMGPVRKQVSGKKEGAKKR